MIGKSSPPVPATLSIWRSTCSDVIILFARNLLCEGLLAEPYVMPTQKGTSLSAFTRRGETVGGYAAASLLRRTVAVGEEDEWSTSKNRASHGGRAPYPIAVPAWRWRSLTDRCWFAIP